MTPGRTDLLVPRGELTGAWQRLVEAGAIPAGSWAYEAMRVAALQHTERVPERADLIFQVRGQRAKPGTIPLPLVCEQETPKGKAKGVNCANCGVCWK